MQNDNLEDAVLFLLSALEKIEEGYPGACREVERAIEEIEILRPDLRGLRERLRADPQ